MYVYIFVLDFRQGQPVLSAPKKHSSGPGRWFDRSKGSLQGLGKGFLLAGALGLGLKMVSSSSNRSICPFMALKLCLWGICDWHQLMFMQSSVVLHID